MSGLVKSIFEVPMAGHVPIWTPSWEWSVMAHSSRSFTPFSRSPVCARRRQSWKIAPCSVKSSWCPTRFGKRKLDLQALCDQSPLHRALNIKLERTPQGLLLHARLGSAQAVDGDGTTTHGGIVATLLDTAATFALIAHTDHDWVTIDLRIDYLRPTPLGVTTIEGEVVRAGRRIGRARGTLRDVDGRICATAIGTFSAVHSG